LGRSLDPLEQRLRDLLGLRVSIVDNHGTGVVTLQYTSRDQLIELLTRLQGGN
jgi:hypothetical protein